MSYWYLCWIVWCINQVTVNAVQHDAKWDNFFIYLFMIKIHQLQMKEYPFQYASTDRKKKSHYRLMGLVIAQWLLQWRCTYRYLVQGVVTSGQWLHETQAALDIYYPKANVRRNLATRYLVANYTVTDGQW